MLSIQVHPTKQAAQEEYRRENEKGTPINAPTRNYKDQNHKPELMVALSDFWLLHGFKSPEDLDIVFEKVPALHFLQKIFTESGYKALYETVMTMPQQKVDELLTPLMQEIVPLYKAEVLQKSDEHFWAARAALTFCKDGTYDKGIFSIYLFNLLHLKEGEAIYQPAGLPHAYLEGQNVEVMANSDNVLRAGLTEKHVDVPELMKHVKFEPTAPKVIPASEASEQTFEAPAEEFLLKKYTVKDVVSFWEEGPAIIFAYHGEGTISARNKKITVKKGEAVLALAGNNVTIHPTTAAFTVFSVVCPSDKI
jgi:mannose-6-phosphate isomerase